MRNQAAREGKITEVSRDPQEATCRSCRRQLGLDAVGDDNQRLAALFVLAITLGLRPGELRKLAWDHVELGRGVVHVWRSASASGDTKTPQSKRSLILPKRAITALSAHKACKIANAKPRAELARDQPGLLPRGWLMYSADALNWRFGRMTRGPASVTGTPMRDATPRSRS